MPTAIPNGGGDDITTSELAAYKAVIAKETGDQTVVEAAIASDLEERATRIGAGWIDSGGPGGFQAAVAAEVLVRAADLQNDLVSSVRQWARPGQERAMMEMLGSLVKALVERDRLLLELRERLNESPY